MILIISRKEKKRKEKKRKGVGLSDDRPPKPKVFLLERKHKVESVFFRWTVENGRATQDQEDGDPQKVLLEVDILSESPLARKGSVRS